MSSDFARQVTATHSGVADDSSPSPSAGCSSIMAAYLSLLLKVLAGQRTESKHISLRYQVCCTSVLLQSSVAAVLENVVFWSEQMLYFE